MSDVVIVEYARKHQLPCPSDVGELRKLMNGFLASCEREGRPVRFDDDVVVTVEDGAVTLTRVD